MNGQTDWTPMIVLLSIYVPLGLTVMGSIAIVTYYRRAAQAQRIGGELIQQMLQRDMSADEIEHILLAWHADPSLAGKLKVDTMPPLKKIVA